MQMALYSVLLMAAIISICNHSKCCIRIINAVAELCCAAEKDRSAINYDIENIGGRKSRSQVPPPVRQESIHENFSHKSIDLW